MNDTFTFPRFGKYFMSDLSRLIAENGLKVLVFGLIPIIAYVLSMLFSFFSPEEYTYIELSTREAFLLFSAFVFVIWIPSGFFGYVTDKRAGSNWTLVPASSLEKTVSMILNTTVLAPAAFLILYMATDFLSTVISGTEISETLLMSFADGHFLGMWKDGFFPLLAWPHISALCFLLGAVFFRKGKISKTILVLFGLGIIALFLMLLGLESLFDMDSISRWEEMHEVNIKAWTTVTCIAEMVVLYVLIYFRIKKIQY